MQFVSSKTHKNSFFWEIAKCPRDASASASGTDVAMTESEAGHGQRSGPWAAKRAMATRTPLR